VACRSVSDRLVVNSILPPKNRGAISSDDEFTNDPQLPGERSAEHSCGVRHDAQQSTRNKNHVRARCFIREVPCDASKLQTQAKEFNDAIYAHTRKRGPHTQP
jgi:hypothetical protein